MYAEIRWPILRTTSGEHLDPWEIAIEALGFDLQQEAALQTLTADVLESSEIEGEKLDAAQVRPSIARRLGMDIGALKATDRNVEGVVEMPDRTPRHGPECRRRTQHELFARDRASLIAFTST